MAYTLEIQEKEGYFLMTASGTLESVDDLAGISRSMQEKADQCHCRRFLIDETTVNKTIDPHDISVFAESKVDNPYTRLRVAAVFSPEEVSRLRWIETFLQNRSLTYRQFSSIEEARQWLMSSKP